MTAEHALRSLHGTYDFDMKYHRNVLNSDKPWVTRIGWVIQILAAQT
jgi:hypothetical protein